MNHGGSGVIFLPFIKAISKKFGVPVSLLVKENSKANEFLNQTNYIDEIIHLERDNKINQKHDGLKGFFKLASDLKNISTLFDILLQKFITINRLTKIVIKDRAVNSSSVLFYLRMKLFNNFIV